MTWLGLSNASWGCYIIVNILVADDFLIDISQNHIQLLNIMYVWNYTLVLPSTVTRYGDEARICFICICLQYNKLLLLFNLHVLKNIGTLSPLCCYTREVNASLVSNLEVVLCLCSMITFGGWMCRLH